MGTWAPRAVVVVHGIGEHRRGAALDALVRGLEVAGARRDGVLHETAPFGQPLPPTAVRVSRDGVEADVYEIYWAPLAARMTTARRVLGWLLRATFLPGRALRRPSPKATFDVALGLAGLALAVLVALGAATSLGNLSAAASCTVEARPGCLGPAVERAISGPAVTAGGWRQASAAFGALGRSLDLTDRPLRDFTPDHLADVVTGISLKTWLVLVGVLFLTAQALYRAQQAARGLLRGRRGLREDRALVQVAVLAAELGALFALIQLAPPVLVAFVWVLAAVGAAARAASRFLAESVGDVQVYSNRDENSDHFAAREAIVAAAERVFQTLGDRGYSQIVVVGHSLGAVIAFDVLRRLRLRNPALLWGVEALVTLGAALEKVRYLFERGAQAGSSAERRLQEAARSTASGMAWLNLWYWNDVVADPITTFQGRARPRRLRWRPSLDAARLLEESRRELVVNVSFGAPLAPAPVWTHSRYWDDPAVLGLVAEVALPARAR